MATFQESRANILQYLAGQGWKVVGDLKIPHATAPGGGFRLWFKPQAVYFTEGNHHTLNGARTISYEFLQYIQRVFPSANASRTAAPDRAAIMDRVVDMLATLDDDEIEAYLKNLKARIKALGDDSGMTAADVELSCWVEALRELQAL